MKRLIWLFVAILVVAGGVFVWQRATDTQAATADADLIPLLQDENTAGYARATEPGAVEFPRDLGPHDDYQTEWWYYTGNLTTETGRAFGFQLTFFRRALQPPSAEPEQDNEWRTAQVYLAHFTISDIENERFYTAERFSRGAAGLAGATAAPYQVWLEDWSAREVEPGVVRLSAEADEMALDITLTETLPPVLHGDAGLSQKGPEPGNASYYYSIVQQHVAGTVRTGEETSTVAGLAWKDHEWSTSALSPGAIGWDWFSLQLDNGGALMFFEIRREDGTLEAYSSGSYIAPDGAITALTLGDWEVTVLDMWTSETSGAEYPTAWRIVVPAFELELTGRPLMPNQELNVSTTYWEGAVSFEGSLAGEPISARGYIEMTGYAHTMEGRL